MDGSISILMLWIKVKGVFFTGCTCQRCVVLSIQYIRFYKGYANIPKKRLEDKEIKRLCLYTRPDGFPDSSTTAHSTNPRFQRRHGDNLGGKGTIWTFALVDKCVVCVRNRTRRAHLGTIIHAERAEICQHYPRRGVNSAFPATARSSLVVGENNQLAANHMRYKLR